MLATLRETFVAQGTYDARHWYDVHPSGIGAVDHVFHQLYDFSNVDLPLNKDVLWPYAGLLMEYAFRLLGTGEYAIDLDAWFPVGPFSNPPSSIRSWSNGRDLIRDQLQELNRVIREHNDRSPTDHHGRLIMKVALDLLHIALGVITYERYYRQVGACASTEEVLEVYIQYLQDLYAKHGEQLP